MERDKDLLKELKNLGVKNKDMKRLLHSFEIIETVAFDINKSANEIFSAYQISKLYN